MTRPEPGDASPIWPTLPSMRLPSTRTIGVAGSDDGLVRVWDLESRDLLYEPLKSHDGKVNAVAVGNLRGRLIAASGGNDRTVRVWDLEVGRPLGAPLEGHRRKVRAVAVGELRDRPIVVSGSNDNTVRVWDVDSGRPLYEPFVGHDSNVTAVSVGAVRGRAIAVSGSEDETLRVWDLEAGALLGVLRGHDNWVNAVAVGTLRGRAIAVSGSCDESLRVWDLETGTPLGVLRGHDDWVNAVAVGELGGRLIAVSGGNDKMVRMWDLEEAVPRGEPLAGHDDWVTAVAVGAIGDRSIAVSGGLDKSMRVWDLSAGGPLGWPLLCDHSVKAVAQGKIHGGPSSASSDSEETSGAAAWRIVPNFRQDEETTSEPEAEDGSTMPMPPSDQKISVRLSVQPARATAGDEITCRVDIDQIDAKVRGGRVELGYQNTYRSKDNHGTGRNTEWVSVRTAQLFERGLAPGPQFVHLAVPVDAPPTIQSAVEWYVQAVIDRRRGFDAWAEAPLVVRAAPGAL